VSDGRIVLDGVDLRDWNLTELRKQFGIVLQDVHLFSGTVASNIRLGSREITDQQVAEAAANVHLDRFIAQLPNGFDEPVGERGASLSAGQKQLISFARALAHDPRVLILDESTSSVDTETEILIREVGTHQDLLSQRGIYYRLYQLQYQDQEVALSTNTMAPTEPADSYP